jgi:hypothetical protein
MSARLLVVGTYRDTELGRSHPLAATLADLRREGFADRVSLGGLGSAEIVEYLAAVGHDNRALGRELADITSGNPFFLIEVLRHLVERGGTWEPGSLPEGVREATGRRRSRLSDRTNEALSVAAVAGASFDLGLVEHIGGGDLTEEIAESLAAGLVVEDIEHPGRFRFAHALVRQVLLTELVTLKRVRLHRSIAELLEQSRDAGDADARLADLAYHWFECASAGSAAKAVAACRRAADRAMERVAYEEAGDLYGMALQALDGMEETDRDTSAALHLARCDALLTAGEIAGARAAIDALEREARGSERLAAWYSTYEGLLAVLAEPDRLTEIVQSIGAAASAMRAVGDLAGEAKAHYVHASALERLGRIGAAEQALDAALGAARAADDRRLADTILAEAPPAALWGPRPVTRASGTCLDVIRVLRVTHGAPAVEAVALRCQAVLEALRGRTDAARRMIGSARRTVDRLGLAHRRLEADVAAGFIELLAGEAAVAEPLLRTAYEELRERGLDGEAAQAAAFLGRALLLQGRVDEADAVAAGAAELAGGDLKAAIAWRDVRAEAAARRGELDQARALATEAVALASATDALLLVADARLTLATVLLAAGDREAATAEAERAADACEAKGASALLARLGSLRPSPRPDGSSTAAPRPATAAIGGRGRDQGRLAIAATLAMTEAANRRDFAAVPRTLTPRRVYDDRRPFVGRQVVGYTDDEMMYVLRTGARFTRPELIEARGERVALLRWTLVGAGFEVPTLGVARVDAHGRTDEYVIFDDDHLEEARAALDEVAARAHERRFENDASSEQSRLLDAFNDGDHQVMEAEAINFEDRRSLVGGSYDRDGVAAMQRIIIEGGGHFEHQTIATRCRSVALQHWRIVIPSPESEVDLLISVHVDEAGSLLATIGFDADAVDDALDELDRVYAANEGAEHAAILEHLATAAAARHARVRHLVRLSDKAGLWVLEPVAEPGERYVEVFSHDGSRVTESERFALDDLDAALVCFEERSGTRFGADEPFANAAWASARAFEEAVRADDFDRARAILSPDYVYDDRRTGLQLLQRGDDALSILRAMVELDQLDYRRELLATRGDRVALTREVVSFMDGQVGPAEVEAFNVVVCDEHGRQTAMIAIGPDQPREAYRELDGCHAALGGAGEGAVADAFAARDWAGLVALFDPACSLVDDRADGTGRLDREGLIDGLRRLVAGIPDVEVWVDHLRTTDRASLARVRIGGSRDGQPFERSAVVVCSFARTGRIVQVRLLDDEAVDEARADFSARSEPPAAERYGNLAWETILRYRDASHRRDIAGVRACRSEGWEFVAPKRTAVWPGTAASEVDGLLGHGEVDLVEGLFELDDFSITTELLATRGDRLALGRDRTAFVDQDVGLAEMEVLWIAEVDTSGRFTREAVFAPDQPAEAYADLDRRYVEQGGPDLGSFRSLGRSPDRDELSRRFTPSCTLEDARGSGLGRLDRDDLLSRLGGVAELHIDHVRTHERAWLAVVRFAGAREGTEDERTLIAVSAVDRAGRITSVHLFGGDDVDGAQAAFAALGTPASNERFGNLAWATAVRFRDACNRRDMDGVRACRSEGYYQFSASTRTDSADLLRDGDVDVLEGLFALDDFSFTTELVATRGDRLALLRERAEFVDGDAGLAEVEVLGVMEVDRDGLLLRDAVFDPAWPEEAYDELDRLFVEQGGPDLRPYRQAENARDWDRYLSLFAPSLTFEDARPVGWGRLDLAGYVEHHRTLSELSPDEYMTIDHLVAHDDVASLIVGRSVGTIEGGAYEMTDTVSVSLRDAQQRITHLRLYDLEDFDQARAWFDRMTTPGSNAAWRAAVTAEEAINAKDRARLDELLAPDFTCDERRVVGSWNLGTDLLHATIELDECANEVELIETRGDDLALVWTTVRFRDGRSGLAEMAAPQLFQVDAAGRIRHVIGFSDQDLDLASHELHARHDALAVDGPSPVGAEGVEPPTSAL